MDKSVDYEKLGAFYLGKRFDTEKQAETEELLLYDSKDLTTHGVIVGMTGSGKTGLGVGLIEEAAIDGVPVIAIDPKGDLANLMLTFPKLQPADFEPWVDPQAASNKGQTTAEFAAKQAAMWKSGLESWGQSPARIQKLKDAAEFSIYTPGSSAGIPISVLGSLNAPSAAVLDDMDSFAERVQATATGLLTLLGVDADPVTSREHILLANILQQTWAQGTSLDIAAVIGLIQKPPFDKIGVLSLESFYPAADRFKLAMQFNNLLAAPGFASWLEGAPLDAQSLLYTPAGKPKVSIISIAHLPESQRMFVVTLLLSEILSWMRAQSGTGSLRALIYMDEVFGYLPPSANPPSKRLFLTLLKQARAFGVGLTLSTQNPVDLDYKALSNAGTWCIGRLQTERDKARLIEGLEGAASGGHFDRGRTEQIIAGLGKRQFLLHNVHEKQDVVFNTRWVLSYLAGPMTRDQIRKLMANRPAPAAAPTAVEAAAKPVAASKPVLPNGVPQVYLPVSAATASDAAIVYHPFVLGAAEVFYSNKTHKVEHAASLTLLHESDLGIAGLDWSNAEAATISMNRLAKRGIAGAEHAEVPAAVSEAKAYAGWERDLKSWIRNERPLTLLRCPEQKLTATPEEDESGFRARLALAARETRDLAVGKLRDKYGRKQDTLEKRVMSARQAVEREQAQASQKKYETALTVGGAILGAFLGRKGSAAGKVTSAMRSAGRIGKEAGDVARAEEKLAAYEQDIRELEAELQREIEALDARYDAATASLDEVVVRATSTAINIQLVGLAWAPYVREDSGRLRPAWG